MSLKFSDSEQFTNTNGFMEKMPFFHALKNVSLKHKRLELEFTEQLRCKLLYI